MQGLVFFVYILAALVTFLLNGCVSLQPRLWPPEAGERTYPVYVSLGTWHGMIGLPSNIAVKPAASVPEEQGRTDLAKADYEEWGYAERQWYVEGEQGSGGAMRALLWPTMGVVEVARYDRLWAERTPQPPAAQFLFHVTEAGLLRLRRHLLSTLATDEPIAAVDQSVFYGSGRRYHLFHHCHHYVARALQQAGLPVSPVWAMSRTLLSMQLVRAQRVAEDFTPEVNARQLLAD